MPHLQLPFERTQGEDLPLAARYRSLPAPLQTACDAHPHLLEYLALMPVDEVGVPQLYPELSRKLGSLKERNLIYQVSDDVFIHVYSSRQDERDYYVPIEPGFAQQLDEIIGAVEARLLDFTLLLADASTNDDRKAALLRCLDRICAVGGGDRASRRNGHSSGPGTPASHHGRVHVTAAQMVALRYWLVREKVGMGTLEAMARDPYIEDISCAGVGPLFLEHKVFGSLLSVINFSSFEDLDEFILRLAERIGKPVTMRRPIVDAVLLDGSRINIVFGREVSQRGSNFTIRKFSGVPMSILELVELKSLNYLMAAYLSLVLEEGLNVFVAGETASGKTTLLNAITTFIPLGAKVISIEDTPELQVPHKNWLREATKSTGQEDGGADVTMFDLLKAALRQRPNVIIVGEIRGVEGSVAFGAMQTGHAVMATFHAGSVEKLIQRITGDPINVPKTYVDNLNVVVIQNAVKLPDGRMGRRATSINEIVNYDASTNSFSFVEVFRWDPADDTFEFLADKNSFILEQKIAVKRGIPANRKWEIYALLERRAKVLEVLHKERKVTNFYDLLQALATVQRQGIF